MRVISDFNTSVEKAFSEIDPRWHDYDGLVVCGSHTPSNVEQSIRDIREARETGIPFYGECFGYQLACIEWARNVMGIKDAASEEYAKASTFVVIKRPEMKIGFHEGETWWSNYEVREDVAKSFEKHPANMFAVPYHPSYQSSLLNPHPLIKDFLKYCKYEKN